MKAEFLRIYEAELKARYAWTNDEAKLRRFMVSCENTLNGDTTWLHEGEAVTAAWRALGKKGRPTLKGLRAL